MEKFFNRYASLALWLLLILPVGTAIVWVLIAAGGYNGGIERGVNLTHDWMNLLINISEAIPGLGWATDQLQGWKDSLSTEIFVKNVPDLPDHELFRIWATWAISFVAIWLLLVIASSIVSGFFGWSFSSRGGGGNGGGTQPAGGRWDNLMRPIAFLILILVLLWPGFWLYDKVVDRIDDYRISQSFQERLEADEVDCVPDNSNVLQLDQVDQCVGLLHSSSASDATKESLTIVLGETCYAYDAYAATPAATPTWERRANREVPPSVYGDKAQWLADQGIPCSVEPAQESRLLRNAATLFFFWIVVPLIFAVVAVMARPTVDAMGTQLPLTHPRSLTRMGIRALLAAVIMVVFTMIWMAIF